VNIAVFKFLDLLFFAKILRHPKKRRGEYLIEMKVLAEIKTINQLGVTPLQKGA